MIYMEEAKRSSLPDNVFGLPEDRKFPLDTEQHVRSAIKLFGHCDESKKHKLAKNIKKAANKYGIEIPETTQVYKYLNESYGFRSNYSYIDELCFIESSNKSKLQNNFKKKTGKNFKIIDINNSQAIKYMMEKENKDKKFITDLIKPFKGCIAVDTETDIEAGYIFITKKDNTISPLWIFEDYRGYGLGEKLLVEGMNKYNADGLWVYTDNEVAIRLYEKHGFYKTEHIEKRKDGELVFMNLKSNIKESYITESNNISYSESFDDVLNIVNSLNNKELHYICNGTFKKSPYVFYRKVLLVNNDPASFIEVYELPQLKNNGFIVIATKSKYRKMGFSKDLVDNFLNNDIKHYRNINRLIWKFDTDNYKSKKFAKTLGFEDYMGHGLGELVMDINESYIMEKVSDLNKNHKQNGYVQLSSFNRLNLQEVADLYSDNKMVKHLRLTNNTKGYLYTEKSNKIVAVVNVEYKDNGENWIQGLEIAPDYQGYGLSKQLLDVATNDLNAKYLSVNKNNKLAKDIYDKYGFEVYDETRTMYFMKNTLSSLKESYIMENDFNLPDDETPSEIVNNQYDSIQALLDDKDPKHIYLSSDWHVFKNHYKKEANYVNTNDIISWCKKNIKYDDVFMYLGDISYRWANEEDKSKAQEIFKSLPGIKILVLGNHDIMAGKDFYEGCGFHYVFQELKWSNYTFTHKPIQMENTSEDALNIHGHIHKWEGYNTTDGSKNVNVYPWYYNNKPVTLDYIINYKDKLMKDNKRTNWVGMGESVVMEKEDFIHSTYVKESEWKSKHRAKFVAAYKNMESKLKTYGNSLKYDKLIIDCADRGNGEWTSEEYIKYMDKFKGGPNDRASGICTKSLPVCRINKNNIPVLKRKAIEDKVVNIMNECIPNEYRKSENGYKKMFFFIRNNGGGVYSLIANSIIMNESTIEDPIIKECSDMINDFINKTKKIDEWAMASFNPILPTTKPYILKAVNDSGDVINSKLYALSPDIISDKYLVVDENSKLSIVDSSYFNSYNLEVYQYTGNELNIGKLKEAYDNNTIVSPNYIYETLSGKELLSSDQIDFDESFTKVDLELLYEKRMTELATINEQYNSSKNMTCVLPIINESSILNCNTYNFDILEDVDGVFARNRYTGKRTRSVDRDYQITEAMIKTII